MLYKVIYIALHTANSTNFLLVSRLDCSKRAT